MTDQIKKTINENLNRVAETFINPINQRLSNPLIGSFGLSWIILNWQPLVFLLFSKKVIEDKLAYIQDHFYGSQWSGSLSWLMYIIFPLLISLLYAIGLPRIENALEAFNLKPRENKMSRIHQLNIKEYDSRIEYAKKQAEIENVKADYMAVEELNQKINLLNTQIQDRNQTIEEYSSQLTELRSAYKDDLKDLSNSNEKFEIASRNLSNIITDIKNVILNNYKGKGLLSQEQSSLLRQIIDIPSLPNELKRYLSDELNLNLTKNQAENIHFVTLVPSSNVSSLDLLNVVSDLLLDLGVGYSNIKFNDNRTISLNVFGGKNLTIEGLHSILTALSEVDHVSFG